MITSENLFQGQKVTVALGQRGDGHYTGCGGSFVVIEKQNGPEPMFVAGGGGPWFKESVPPQSYARGLKGGQGSSGKGGFGGGGARYLRNNKYYFGAGGGFSGGSAEIFEGSPKQNILSTIRGGGGGDSFSVDKNAIFDYILVDYGKCKIEFLN